MTCFDIKHWDVASGALFLENDVVGARSVLGGLLGVVLGIATCMTLAHVLEWSIALPSDAIAVTPLISAISATVGVFFGLDPASRAARLDAIAALHHE